LFSFTALPEKDSAAANFKADRARDSSAYFFRLNQHTCLPEDFSHCHVIAFSDIESAFEVHHLRAASYRHNHPALVRPHFVGSPKQERNPGVSEHEWLAAGFFGVDLGLRQHEVQQAANASLRIVDQDREAGSERIGYQDIAGLVR
jgi:hypothetical protein